MGAATATPVSTARPRLSGSDAVRAAAMIGVICIHASAWGPSSPYAGVGLVSRFSVPAFMVLTGTLLAYQYTGRTLGVAFMRRRLGRSLIPWLSWAPVFIAFDFFVGSLKPTAPSVLSFLQYGGGHLWFLLLIPQLYLLFLVWPRRATWTVAILAMLVQVGLCLIRLFVALPGWQSQVMVTYGFLTFPFWIGYFGIAVAAGRTLAAGGGRIPVLQGHARTAAVVAGAVLIAATGWLLLNLHYHDSAPSWVLTGTNAFLNPVLPLFVFSIVIWFFVFAPAAMAAAGWLRWIVDTLSEQSLGLYIVHPVLLFFVGRVLYGMINSTTGALSVLGFAIFVIATLVATSIAVRLLMTTPLAVTIGTPRRPLRLPKLGLASSRRTAQPG